MKTPFLNRILNSVRNVFRQERPAANAQPVKPSGTSTIAALRAEHLAAEQRLAAQQDSKPLVRRIRRKANPRGVARCRCVAGTALSPALCPASAHPKLRWCPRHRMYSCLDCGCKDRQPTIRKV